MRWGFLVKVPLGNEFKSLLLVRLAFLVALLSGLPLPPAYAQSSRVCDQVFESLPERASDRIELGKPCVEALPELPVADQIRIAREYSRTLPGFIPESDFDDVVQSLNPAARLPLEAHGSRFYSFFPGEETVERLNELSSRVASSDDQMAMAHLEFAWANRIFRLGGDNSEMERRLRIALQLARDNDIVGLIPFVHNALAVRAKVDGEFVAAIDEYRLAIEAFEANSDRASTGIVYNNIANVFSDLGDNQQAIRIYGQAIAIYDEFDPEGSERSVAARMNRATAYSREGEYELAVEAFEDARRNNEKLGFDRLTGLIDYQNAIALFGLGRDDVAIPMAERAVPMILENRDPSEAAAALNWLAARYLDRSRLQDAQEALGQAREIMEPGGEGVAGLLDNPGNTYWAQEYAQSMGSLLMKLDRTEEAVPYFEAALSLSNDRFEKEKIEAVSNSGLLFELRDRDKRIQRMDDRARISELQLSQSRLQTTLGFSLALAIGLVAFLFLRSWRFQKSLAASKDTFLAEIHHRTKNNLQLLTSLFNMDARRGVSAEEAKQRQLEAASRARTMAILHEHIYSKASQDEREVDVEEFVERLLSLIEEVFGRKGVKLERSVESAKLDIDRITPLGLLICELLTNAYKHAFESDDGVIEFSLKDLGKTIEVTVQDNGVGLPPSSSKGDADGIGMTLIRDLADQLDATRSLRSDSAGTMWMHRFAKTSG
jgi:two-component sensor histidine kinase